MITHRNFHLFIIAFILIVTAIMTVGGLVTLSNISVCSIQESIQ